MALHPFNKPPPCGGGFFKGAPKAPCLSGLPCVPTPYPLFASLPIFSGHPPQTPPDARLLPAFGAPGHPSFMECSLDILTAQWYPWKVNFPFSRGGGALEKQSGNSGASSAASSRKKLPRAARVASDHRLAWKTGATTPLSCWPLRLARYFGLTIEDIFIYEEGS